MAAMRSAAPPPAASCLRVMACRAPGRRGVGFGRRADSNNCIKRSFESQGGSLRREAGMKPFLARWRPGHVIAAWFVYWIGLLGVTVSFTNTVLHVTVTQFGKVTHVASASLGQMAFWVGVPPLALYALWLFTR